MSGSIVIAARCSFCSRQRAPGRIHQLTTGQGICDYCLDWHQHALAFLGGAVPRGCQECASTWEFLRESTLGDEVRMYVVPRDGIYQLLCAACARQYLPKRADIYKGTQFGAEVLKI